MSNAYGWMDGWMAQQTKINKMNVSLKIQTKKKTAMNLVHCVSGSLSIDKSHLYTLQSTYIYICAFISMFVEWLCLLAFLFVHPLNWCHQHFIDKKNRYTMETVGLGGWAI